MHAVSLSILQHTFNSVKSIIKKVALGQSDTVREACLEKTELTSDGDILKCLQAAVKQSHHSNNRVNSFQFFELKIMITNIYIPLQSCLNVS